MPSFRKDKQKSIIKSTLESKKSVNDSSENFKVSFQFIDTSQKFGSTFKDWQKSGLLAKMLECFSGYCCNQLLQQVDGDKFSIYGNFPPKDKTLFSFPEFVPEDANWARIHITGKVVVIGHIVKDTFYVVFLDKTHKFWLTKRITDN
ncbi:hypothetical protein ACSV4D_06945 [Flavobacterium sp. ARAG 55.4]|uniref:hypothetical protein n=1 Tax=Flavobacterium sp. ARAG 55.4 TaxID=3451357 RepID=UPI003F4596FE